MNEQVDEPFMNSSSPFPGPDRERSTMLLPTHDPQYITDFLSDYYEELCQEARRACWKNNIPDFAEDALSISIEKFMCASIEARGPRSAIAFAVTIVKNTCIDETRRRGRQAVLGGSMTGDLGEDEDRSSWLPEPQAGGDPERAAISELELAAVQAGFDHLPELMAATHKNVARDLQVVRCRYLLGMSWDEVAAELEIDKANRQSAARGRELLRGWVHALCGTRPEPELVNRKYWQKGFAEGERWRKAGVWPPRAQRN